jgi:hypothetical protein
MVAGGVVTATAVATSGSRAPAGPVLEVKPALIRARNLYPTSPTHPDPAQVAVAAVELEGAPAQRVTATCTNCTPGSPEAQQFGDLRVEVGLPGSPTFYTGPLDGLDATVAPGAPLKVWLADSGQPQAQGVITEWSFNATGTTVSAR